MTVDSNKGFSDGKNSDSNSVRFDNKLVVVTCYDSTFARLCAQAEINYLLVGDSAGMVLFGETNTHHVKLSDILLLTKSVRKGLEACRREMGQAKRGSEIIADFPVDTYRTPCEAIETARALLSSGADLVKLEGALPEIVQALHAEGIRVCAHLGLTPQTATEYKVQARDAASADKLFQDAIELEQAGAELLVLEMIPALLAQKISEKLLIPTIGIGAGPFCDGQVLVLYDLLGLNPKFHPKFLKTYLNGADLVIEALKTYSSEVRSGKFPDREHSFQ